MMRLLPSSFLSSLLFYFNRSKAHLARSGHRHSAQAARRAISLRLVLENLEERVLLAGPNWDPRGPGPIVQNANVLNLNQNNAVSGAIEAIAVHPTDPGTVYVATVNGGVWGTTNILAGDPATINWTPRTDTLPSLSTSAIAFSPLDANTLYVGTGSFSSAAGDGGPALGVLKTTNGGTNWIIQGRTDFGGQRVRSVVPTSIVEPTGQVVLVATIDDNGGAYRSADGGSTWGRVSTGVGASGLPNGNVSHLVADPGNAQRFYAAVPGHRLLGGLNVPAGEAGIYRSDNGGVSWTKVTTGIPQAQLDAAGRIELTVGCDKDPRCFFGDNPAVASSRAELLFRPDIVNQKEFRWKSFDPILGVIDTGFVAGARWELEGANPTRLVFTGSSGGASFSGNVLFDGYNRAVVDVVKGGRRVRYLLIVQNPVFAGLINPQGDADLKDVYRTTNLGASWRRVQNPQQVLLAKQGTIHFSILADRNDPDVFYIGGDRVAQSPFHGNLFRVVVQDPNPAADAWTSVVAAGANNTAPHADSRDLAFDSAGNLLEGDDGGLVRLTTPDQAARQWQSRNGNIQPTEVRSAAVDNRNNADPADDVFLIGAQDNGSADRNAATGVWTGTPAGGDGVKVQADDLGGVRYFTTQELSSFERRTGLGGGAVTNAARRVAGAAGHFLNRNFDTTINGIFTVQYAVNAVVANRILLGTNARLYESTNQGDDFTSVSGLADGTMDGVDNNGNGMIDEAGEMIPANVPGMIGTVTAIAYGGRAGGIDNPDVAWVGTDSRDIFLRTAAGGAFNVTNFNAAAADIPLDIVLDPNNWHTAYVVDRDDVFVTTDSGATWRRLTSNLLAVINTPIFNLPLPGNQVNTVQLFSGAAGTVAIVGGFGGVYRARITAGVLNGTEAAVWDEYGMALPNTTVRDLEYDARSDTLAAGTLGRGVWIVPNVSASIVPPPPMPLLAVSEPGTATLTLLLTLDLLGPIADQASIMWEASGRDPMTLSKLGVVVFQITDLPGAALGLTSGNAVLIDQDAAGSGWFVDLSPFDSLEFSRVLRDDELGATHESVAVDRIDVLTIVVHELGHVLGLEHADAHGLMRATLDVGVRRILPSHDSEVTASTDSEVMPNAVSNDFEVSMVVVQVPPGDIAQLMSLGPATTTATLSLRIDEDREDPRPDYSLSTGRVNVAQHTATFGSRHVAAPMVPATVRRYFGLPELLDAALTERMCALDDDLDYLIPLVWDRFAAQKAS